MTAQQVGAMHTPVRRSLGESLRGAATQMTPTGWLVLAAGFAAAAWVTVRSAPPVVMAVYAVALAATLIAAAIDSVEQRLPNALTIGGSMVALAGMATAALVSDGSDWRRAIAGGAIFAGWILAATLIVPGSYGLGDVKLAALCGLLLTWHSWTALIAGMVATQIVITATLLAARHRRKERAPLGPSFAVGTLIALAIAAM